MSWKVLILDVSYQPVDVMSWQDAITLLLKGGVEVLEEYDDVTIRSERLSFSLPSVLRLLKKVSRRKSVQFSRFNIFNRDNWTCQYCGKKKRSEDLNLDHVVPIAQGGIKSWENIVTACIPCNSRKAARTPEQAGLRLRKTPVKPNWTPQLTIRITEKDPESWRNWIYWHGELVTT